MSTRKCREKEITTNIEILIRLERVNDAFTIKCQIEGWLLAIYSHSCNLQSSLCYSRPHPAIHKIVCLITYLIDSSIKSLRTFITQLSFSNPAFSKKSWREGVVVRGHTSEYCMSQNTIMYHCRENIIIIETMILLWGKSGGGSNIGIAFGISGNVNSNSQIVNGQWL